MIPKTPSSAYAMPGIVKAYYNEYDLMSNVADFFELPIEELRRKRRMRRIVVPRQVCIHLMRNMFRNRTTKEIGDYFGGFDHATVIHASKVVNNLLTTDREFAARFNELQATVKANSIKPSNQLHINDSSDE